MKKFKLSSQLLILFTTVTILSAVVFGLITYRNYESIYLEVAKNQLNTYVESVAKREDITENYYEDKYVGYVVAEFDDASQSLVRPPQIISNNLKELEKDVNIFTTMATSAYSGIGEFVNDKDVSYYLTINKRRVISDNLNEYIVGIMHEEKVKELKMTSAQNDVLLSFAGTFIAFAIIIIVGNIILALWSREITKRIQFLSSQISTIGQLGYKKEISVSGSDEITELSLKVENMRQEIEQNEMTKQDMFQNLSHDFKTPIAVIKSYAEAIEDGITDISDAKIITEQTKKLEQKVNRLLEYNKLEYIDTTKPLELVKLKNVINKVLGHYRILLRKYELIVELDDSIFKGFEENYITIVSNIIDNALRYVKTKIIITLKDQRLTIYNDGDPIDEKYVKNLFRPYEKGSEGQFGLGMSIVQKTVNRFGYRLSVSNINDGVMFVIEP